MTAPHMQYVLTGFKQDQGYRVFAFDRIGEDRTRTAFAVRADLGLIRGYGIHVQDLPLLCRAMLERSQEEEHAGAASRALTYSEDEMRLYAKDAAATAAARRKSTPPRRPPPTQNLGAGWRTTPQAVQGQPE